jgi:hypothetical protein
MQRVRLGSDSETSSAKSYGSHKMSSAVGKGQPQLQCTPPRAEASQRSEFFLNTFPLTKHALQSVKAERGLDEFGAEWKHAAGAPRAKEAKGRHIVGASVPSVHLRLDGEFRTSMIASWALNSSMPGADMQVLVLAEQRLLYPVCLSAVLNWVHILYEVYCQLSDGCECVDV